jgi:hypothetical protein
VISITANQLRLLTSLDCATINQLLIKNNIFLIKIVDCKFLGIVKTGEFCYDLSLQADNNSLVSKKVYISYDDKMDKVVANLGLTIW